MNMVGTTMILLLILLMILMLAFSGVAIVVITVMIVAIDCSCKEEWLWSEIHSVLSGWGSSQHTSYWGVWFTVLWDSHVARPLHAHMQSWKSWQNPTVVCISIYMCVCSTEEAIKSEARNLPTYVCVHIYHSNFDTCWVWAVLLISDEWWALRSGV